MKIIPMNIRTITTTIFCAVNISLVTARFFIESISRFDGAPDDDPKPGLFLYKCTKWIQELEPKPFKNFINCNPVTSLREKSKIYSTANFYSVTNVELLSKHYLSIKSRLLVVHQNSFWVGYLPQSRPNSRTSTRQLPKTLPEVSEFPSFHLVDHEDEEVEERVCNLGLPNFAPIANLGSTLNLMKVMGINDIAIFWKIKDFGRDAYVTFIQILDHIVDIYFTQIHRTPTMKRTSTFSEYVRPMSVDSLPLEEKHKKGMEDIRGAMKDTMSKLIDPCAMYQISKVRSKHGACFSEADASKYCKTYCRFLKAAFLVHELPGDCPSITYQDPGKCEGSVCMCQGFSVGNSRSFNLNLNLKGSQQYKPFSIPMHHCNNILRVKVHKRILREEKREMERKRSLRKKQRNLTKDKIPWMGGKKPVLTYSESFALNPGEASSLSDESPDSPGSQGSQGNDWSD